MCVWWGGGALSRGRLHVNEVSQDLGPVVEHRHENGVREGLLRVHLGKTGHHARDGSSLLDGPSTRQDLSTEKVMGGKGLKE